MKKQLIIGGGICGAVILILFAINLSGRGTTESPFTNLQIEQTTENSQDEQQYNIQSDEKENDRIVNQEKQNDIIIVDVQGEVLNPGIFEVENYLRIGHVIELAGGLTDYADVRTINQAARIHDEMLIRVPHIDDVQIISNNQNESDALNALSTMQDSRISISTASTTELQTLTGIGPAIAGRIIDYREQYGPFEEIEDLMNVSGIGTRIFEVIKDDIRP